MRTLIIILFALVACKKEIADDGNILFIDGVEVGRYGQWNTYVDGSGGGIATWTTGNGTYTSPSGDSIRFTFTDASIPLAILDSAFAFGDPWNEYSPPLTPADGEQFRIMDSVWRHYLGIKE